jgi:hypothetical protein
MYPGNGALLLSWELMDDAGLWSLRIYCVIADSCDYCVIYTEDLVRNLNLMVYHISNEIPETSDENTFIRNLTRCFHVVKLESAFYCNDLLRT